MTLAGIIIMLLSVGGVTIFFASSLYLAMTKKGGD